jgi:uncharacterized protein (DUF2236 family)
MASSATVSRGRRRPMRDVALLGPDTLTWRVNHEPVAFMGGGRALLLQVAHPLVAAGVEQHSNYEVDPWGRLYGTLDTVVKIVFGDTERSEEAATRLRRRHDQVKGVSEDGVAYDAHDPELLLWVWATLVDTARLLYERCVRPLSDEELFAYACGVPKGACPDSHADFLAYFARMVGDELRVTAGAQTVAHSLVHPPFPRALRPLFAPAVLVTAGLLPPPVRAEYGFAWGPQRQRLLEAWLTALRWTMRLVPRAVRALPVELTATGHLEWPRTGGSSRLPPLPRVRLRPANGRPTPAGRGVHGV